MTDLIDNTRGYETDSSDPRKLHEVKKLPVAQFASALWFLRKGELTKAEIVSMFEMNAVAEAQLDKIIQLYQNSSEQEKAEFHNRIFSAGCLFERGLIDVAKFKKLTGV